MIANQSPRSFPSGGAIDGPFSCSYALTANQLIVHSVTTPLSGFTKIFDTANRRPFYDPAYPTRFVFPATGRYLVVGVPTWDTAATSSNQWTMILNSAGVEIATLSLRAAQASAPQTVSGMIILDVTKGDWISLGAYQDSAGSYNILGSGVRTSGGSYISITYLPGQ